MSCPLTLPSQRVAAETGGHSLRALSGFRVWGFRGPEIPGTVGIEYGIARKLYWSLLGVVWG